MVDGLGPDDCDGGDGPEVLDLLDVVNAFLRRIEKIRFRDSKILNRRKGAFKRTFLHDKNARRNGSFTRAFKSIK